MTNPVQDSYEQLRLPGTNYSTHTYGVPFGDDLTAPKVQELLLSQVGYRQHGVVLATSQGVLQSGTVLAQKTSDKKYYKYVPGASDGTQLPVGLLRRQTDTTNGDTLGNILVSAEVRYDLAYSGGLDANAVTVLNGRVDAVATGAYGVSRFLF